MKKRSIIAVAAVSMAVAMTMFPEVGFCGGGGLPWDDPLTTLQEDLTGPTAFSIALLAGFAAVAALVFSHEMSGWVRGALMAVLGMAFLTGIVNFAQALGMNTGGAVF